MLGAQGAAVRLEGALLQHRGLGDVALDLEDSGEVRGDAQGLRVLCAQAADQHLVGATLQFGGLAELAVLEQRQGEALPRHEHLGVFAPLPGKPVHHALRQVHAGPADVGLPACRTGPCQLAPLSRHALQALEVHILRRPPTCAWCDQGALVRFAVAYAACLRDFAVVVLAASALLGVPAAVAGATAAARGAIRPLCSLFGTAS
mmetsp:Transcript_87835/g.253644  ORF Transcript_87835/g.253644 Transcript_87835/m.253644 type:complete len:204 (-) Transcript_87835:142-753(-)